MLCGWKPCDKAQKGCKYTCIIYLWLLSHMLVIYLYNIFPSWFFCIKVIEAQVKSTTTKNYVYIFLFICSLEKKEIYGFAIELF